MALVIRLYIYIIFFAKTDKHTGDSKAAEVTRSTADGGGRCSKTQFDLGQQEDALWEHFFYRAEMEPEGHPLLFQRTAGYRSLRSSLPLGSLCFCVTSALGRVEGCKKLLLLYVYIGREPVHV